MIDPVGRELTIAELVRQKLATGLTLRQLEERSGGSVPYQTFGKISKGEVKGWPKSRQVIEGTASALGVDAREVVLRYATQFEIDVSEDRSLLASMLPSCCWSWASGAGLRTLRGSLRSGRCCRLSKVR